jgi:hypothetical protein
LSESSAAFDPAIDLRKWSANQRFESAVARRTAERWQRHVAIESLQFSGLIEGLHQAEAVTVLRTTAQRTHRGTIVDCGRDFLGIRSSSFGLVLVALSAVASIDLAGSSTPVVAPPGNDDSSRDLRVVLHELIEERPRLRVSSGESVRTGRLHAAGEDLVILEVDEGLAVLPVATIDEVAVTY